jgi:hypothetical protein
MTEALEILRALLKKVQAEEWVAPAMQRAVTSGIKMSIKALETANETP